LITADALRADHLSINGYPRRTSPNIDAFAEGSWHFTQAMTVIPKTGPSFATLFTGRHPREHGVRSNFTVVPVGLPMLAERLRALGYRTAAFVSGPVLRKRVGFERGFDLYRTHLEGVERVNGAFLRWGKGEWTAPTFVWLHYIDPHGPYLPPQEFESLFLDDEWAGSDQRVSLDHGNAEALTSNKLLGAVPLYQQRAGEDRVAAYVARYDAEIRFMDAAFGEVLKFLRERGLYDQSVVIFTADHGESLGEHRYWFEHGWFAHEPSLRVPLMIKRPGRGEGRAVHEPVSNLDILPTLLALVGAPAGAAGLGSDLFGPLRDRAPILIESSDLYPEKFLGVRTSRWKYLRRTRDGSEELYDLRADPGEIRNLKGEAAEMLATLRRSLRDALGRLEPAAAPASSADPRDDAETLEQLEALGYVP
jgi:arylsulfatase